MEKEREWFIFYNSFWKAIKELPKENQLEIYNAITDYSFTLEEPELTWISKTIWILIKPQLEANNRRYLNWIKPKKKQEWSETEANPKQSQSKPEGKEKEKEKEKVKDKDKDNNKLVQTCTEPCTTSCTLSGQSYKENKEELKESIYNYYISKFSKKRNNKKLAIDRINSLLNEINNEQIISAIDEYCIEKKQSIRKWEWSFIKSADTFFWFERWTKVRFIYKYINNDKKKPLIKNNSQISAGYWDYDFNI